MIAVQILTRPILPLLERSLSAYAVTGHLPAPSNAYFSAEGRFCEAVTTTDTLAANNTTIAMNGFGTSVEDIV